MMGLLGDYSGLVDDQANKRIQNGAMLQAALALLGNRSGRGVAGAANAVAGGLAAGTQAYAGGIQGEMQRQSLMQEQGLRKELAGSSEMSYEGMIKRAEIAQKYGRPDLAERYMGMADKLGGLQKARAAEQWRNNLTDPQFEAGQAALGAGGAGPTNAAAQATPQVDPSRQMLFNLAKQGLIDPVAYTQASVKDNTPIKVGKDEVLLDPRTRQPIFSNNRGPELPSAVREYEYAKSQGYPGDFNQWQLEQRRAGAANTRIDVNTGEKKFDEAAAKITADTYGELFKAGVAGQRGLSQINQLDSLLQRTGGGFAPAAKAYLGQFGVKTEGLSDIQAAQAIINQLVPQQRPAGAGTMSDKDVELFKASLPRLINTPEGNRQIIGAIRGIAEYDAAAGQIAKDVLNRKITQEEADRRLSELRNPLSWLQEAGQGGSGFKIIGVR